MSLHELFTLLFKTQSQQSLNIIMDQ